MILFTWVLVVSVSLSGVSSFEPQPIGVTVGPKPSERVREVSPSPITSTAPPIIHNTKVQSESVGRFPVEEEKQPQSSQSNVKPPGSSDSDFGRLLNRLKGAKIQNRNDETHSEKVSYQQNSNKTTKTEISFTANPKNLEPLETSQHMSDKTTEIGSNPVAVDQSAQKDEKDSVLNSKVVYSTNVNLSEPSHNGASNSNVMPSNNKDIAIRSSEVQISDAEPCENHEECSMINNSDQCKYGSVCTGVMILASSLYYYHSIGAFC